MTVKVTIIGANSYIARNMVHMMQYDKSNEYEFRLYDYGSEQVDGMKPYDSIDVTSKESMSSVDLDCDLVYMFVGKTGTYNGFEQYDTFIDINERALLNLLDAYRRQHSHAKIVFPSTRLVYKGSRTPLSEDADKEFKTIYAINKFACEQYLKEYHNVFNIDYVIFRICVPYGSILPEAVSSFGTAGFMLDKAKNGKDITLYGGGKGRRTITHMWDLCNILIHASQSPDCLNDVYNIGGEDYSLEEMANCIAGRYGVGVVEVPWPEAALSIESGDTVFNDDKLGSKGFKVQRRFSEWVSNA